MFLQIIISIALILFFGGVLLIILEYQQELTSLILADILVRIGTVLFVLGLLGGLVFLCLFLLCLVWS